LALIPFYSLIAASFEAATEPFSFLLFSPFALDRNDIKSNLAAMWEELLIKCACARARDLNLILCACALHDVSSSDIKPIDEHHQINFNNPTFKLQT